jgi:class 3 adenylate cyclase
MRLKAWISPILLLLVFSLKFWAAAADSGTFLFRVYGAKTYGASPQNWAIAQDSRGVMYFGNTDCLLEFDGATWRKIVLPNNSTVRSLAVDGHGKVFVGGQGEIGYLRPNAAGVMEYQSLLPLLAKGDKEFGDVWSIFSTPEGVYFSSYRQIIRIREEREAKVWRPTERFGRAFYIKNQLIVQELGKGLETLSNDTFVGLPGGEAFAKPDVSAVLPIDNDLLIASSKQLLLLTNGHAKEFLPSANSYLQDNVVYAMQYMPDGRIALGTTRGGLLLMDKKGTINRITTERNGLPDDSVTAIFTDRRGDTWLTSGKGVVRFTSSFTYFGEDTGIRGSVVALAKSEGDIYAGTTVGLYHLTTSAEKAPMAHAVDGIKGTVLVLLPDANGLLAGTIHGLYSVEGNNATLITRADVVYDLSLSRRNPDLLYACGRFGIFVMQRAGRTWRIAKSVPAGARALRTVAEDSNGLVWATSRADVWRINLANNEPHIDRFDARNGVPPGWNNVYDLNNSLVFATGRGILRYSEATRRFEPDFTLGKQFGDGTRAVSVVRQGTHGDVWVSGPGYQAIVPSKPDQKLFWMPLLQTGIKETYALWLDDDQSAWSSGEEGLLFRWHPEASLTPVNEFNVNLRRVEANGGKELVYAGAPGISPKPVRLQHTAKALRFEFSAPVYDDTATLYQVRLDNLDKEWPPWTTETRKEFTNLFEGRYRFRVRARDGHNYVSPETVFSFTVLPPWYRTWWAYTLYAVVIALAVQLLFLWRLNRLRLQKKRLEHIVEERTAEVRLQRDRIIEEERKTEQLLLNILPQRIATELRSTGSVAPVIFPQVSVCFADFVGFTLSSEKMTAEQLISSLNLYFTAFDRIMTRYNLEKLKTVGDSYMFVSGLPEERASHAVDAAMAALEVAETVNALASASDGPRWVARVGLHTGPVAAGVVGISKFAYDVWGNTVNLAARLETASLPGLVNISHEMFLQISDFIECRPRGLVRTKEGRDLEMYFARQIKPELLEGPIVDGIPEVFRRRYFEAFSVSPPAVPQINNYLNISAGLTKDG